MGTLLHKILQFLYLYVPSVKEIQFILKIGVCPSSLHVFPILLCMSVFTSSFQSMLHKANPIPNPLLPAEKPPVSQPTPVAVPPPAAVAPAAPREEGWTGPATVPGAPRAVPIPPVGQNQTPTFGAPDVDLRQVDPRLSRMGDQDLRVPPVAPVPAPQAPPRDIRENFLPDQ